jgi:uncharacterized damage-inducible protein DinB
MSPEWLSALARYNRWMNENIYNAAASLDDEARKRDVGAFFKSIHGTLNHILVADRIWLGRFTGATFPATDLGPGGISALDQELYSDFEELRRERARTDDELTAWVAELTTERLAQPVVFIRRGVRQEVPLWWTVAHVFNHHAHHRGQVTTLLMQQGRDPGVTDLYAMLVAERSATPNQ